MSRTHVRYRCAECGYESPKWLGRCGECGEWGSFGEAPVAAERRAAPSPVPASRPVALTDVDPLGAPRRPTTLPELDRVLGGGLVDGSVTLLGGEPGMGKSTLLLQALTAMAHEGARCLLVAAEESPAQVRLRAGRLGPLAAGVLVVGETSLPAVCAHVEELRPDVLAVDSIQTVHDPDAPGAPGSVSQVRDCAQRLVRLAKDLDVATVLVGHVTKDGALAGPRVLEHVVDTVLAFEGDRHHALRMLRALKHRFGATDELGLMEMTGGGLLPLADPSALFLADRRPGAPGSVVAPVLEGVRPLCVEVQALVHDTPAPVPRRVAQAVDGSRLAMLLAVLQRRAGISVSGADVYASVAGGVRVAEPGGDLAIALAVAGARLDRPVAADTVALGEIGLGGEVRQVAQTPRRLAEAVRLGMRRAIVPVSTPDVRGIEIVRVEDVLDACLAAGFAPPG
ncbi:MAG: DNA repair protein RadA [Acidimicrobiia bacterium]|nr:MAG: DNA repair protein RadA [Acidimicrobiia bacterium]